MADVLTNAAQVFLRRFPTAEERTGWSDDNLRLLAEEVRRRGVPLERFDRVCVRLLGSQARLNLAVPPFGEVMHALGTGPEANVDRGTVDHLRRLRAEYRPWSEAAKSARRAWLRAFAAGDTEAMAKADAELRELGRGGGAYVA